MTKQSKDAKFETLAVAITDAVKRAVAEAVATAMASSAPASPTPTTTAATPSPAATASETEWLPCPCSRPNGCWVCNPTADKTRARRIRKYGAIRPGFLPSGYVATAMQRGGPLALMLTGKQ